MTLSNLFSPLPNPFANPFALNPIDVVDGDLATDGRADEERPETILVAGRPVDFIGLYNVGDLNTATRTFPIPIPNMTAGDALALTISAVMGMRGYSAFDGPRSVLPPMSNSHSSSCRSQFRGEHQLRQEILSQ